jgi:hypothetical protein
MGEDRGGVLSLLGSAFLASKPARWREDRGHLRGLGEGHLVSVRYFAPDGGRLLWLGDEGSRRVGVEWRWRAGKVTGWLVGRSSSVAVWIVPRSLGEVAGRR